MTSRFLFNQGLWAEIERVPAGKSRVYAAIAYVAKGGARLLRLRPGDVLVTDMSLASVRSGRTDPREIAKMLANRVEVYSRSGLHAKVVVTVSKAIVGSANISHHSKEHLDEAAILIDDRAVVNRARRFVAQLCTEPVRAAYLKKCLEEYNEPEFVPGGARRSPSARPRPQEGKLWIIGGLRPGELPAAETGHAARAVAKAAKKALDFEECTVEYLYYNQRCKFFDRLREGDWALHCFAEGRGFEVWPPARFLGIAHHPRGRGRLRHLLLFEEPKAAAPIRWTQLRALVPRIGAFVKAGPRTAPLASDQEADAVLRLWDRRGRLRG
ncbi:MAG TPA: phospholipase D family protein [Thermoanaerobaculia bacterium]|nr:phospholipase D family protein [Thermoanaerobaculia bacterium]